jgi:hypothetical protein
MNSIDKINTVAGPEGRDKPVRDRAARAQGSLYGRGSGALRLQPLASRQG